MEDGERGSPSPRVLLFDLGGVLVQWVGVDGLVELAGGRLTREDARRFWLESPWVRRFERGTCTPGKFAVGVVAELGLPLSPDEFLRLFVGWDLGPFPGALELLDSLRDRWILACLSNNNEVHWTRLCGQFGLHQRFHYTFLSHEIGLIKPDAEIFRYVVAALKTTPGQILFLDDNPECTEAAAKQGFAVASVRGIEEVRRVLGRLRDSH